MEDKIIFAYWPVRGLGQVSRLLLAYTQANWEDFKYKTAEQWFDNDKKNLGFDFPNVPYIIQGNFKLTQSQAINRYIIKRSNKKELLGKSLKEQAIVNCLIGVLGELRNIVVPLFYDKNWKNLEKEALQKTKVKLQYLSKFIGDNEFLIGYLTLPDFLLAQLSFYIEKIWPQQNQKHKFIPRIRINFESLPEIKAYYEKQTSFKEPFCSAFMRSIDL